MILSLIPPYDPGKIRTHLHLMLKDFNKEDQIRLFKHLTLDKRGVKVMLSNPNTDFIRNL